MEESIRTRIDVEVRNHDVVLFMKGTPSAPRCGFSATVVGILDELVGTYQTIDVLADGEVREAIKEYSDWPTIPQLYVKGEFVGGCDLVREMYESGELEDKLGLEVKSMAPPAVRVDEEASRALQAALDEARAQEPDVEHRIRVSIDGDFQHGLSVGGPQPRDVSVDVGGLTLMLDRGSARRAEGLAIRYVNGPEGGAFKLENPNEPPRVKSISPSELAASMKQSESVELFDVRSQKERDTASIPGAKLLDRDAQKYIMDLDRATPLYFHCHHGQRSQQAAAFFLSHGFVDVYNVTGGIDAWSLEVDPSVPRY